VESEANPLKKNKKENAIGIVQIRQVMLDEYNIKTHNHLELKQMYNIERSKSVFAWHCNKFHYSDIEGISRAWNGGPRGIKKHSTKEYYKKVMKILGNKENSFYIYTN
jgi:hypothetical protein